MLTTYLRRRFATVLVLVVIAVTLVVNYWVRRWQRRRFFEQVRYRSGQALLRYVQLSNQCSEEAAYQRLATFVKRRVPSSEHTSVEYLLAHDRQSLLGLAQRILAQNPDEIDEI